MQQQYDVELVHEPTREAAVVRFEVDLPHIGEQMGPAFEQVAGYLGRRHVPVSGPALACYDLRLDGMDAAVGFGVAEPFEGGEGVEWFVLPEVDALATVHQGPYDHLVDAYDAVRVHAEALGRHLSGGRMWEEYLTGPDVPPAQMRTRVIWPLQPA